MIRVATVVGPSSSVDAALTEASRRLGELVDDVAEWDVVDADLTRVTKNGNAHLLAPHVKGRVVFAWTRKRKAAAW